MKHMLTCIHARYVQYFWWYVLASWWLFLYVARTERIVRTYLYE